MSMSIDLNHQKAYWNRVSQEKTFTYPLDLQRFRERISLDACVLDFGCGYGRTLNELWAAGYRNLMGVDISGRMVERGGREYPHLDLRVIERDRVDLEDSSVGAILLFAVLTCVPGDEAQRGLVRELFRILEPGGLLFAGDYWLQGDERNRERYDAARCSFERYGVFEHREGVVFRHHDRAWIHSLFRDFGQIELRDIHVVTMNGNRAKAFQYIGAKPKE